MVEPYATMMASLGVGTVVKRTGDLWKGAPGCSLAATARLVKTNPLLVQRAVTAFVRGAAFVVKNPGLTAEIASRYIGINAKFIRAALDFNKPDVNAIRNTGAMEAILTLMIKLGYTSERPSGFTDLTFLDKAQEILKDRICD